MKSFGALFFKNWLKKLLPSNLILFKSSSSLKYISILSILKIAVSFILLESINSFNSLSLYKLVANSSNLKYI